jgi:hypothetical protein
MKMKMKIKTTRDIYLEVNRQRIISFKDDLASDKKWVAVDSIIYDLTEVIRGVNYRYEVGVQVKPNLKTTCLIIHNLIQELEGKDNDKTK